MMLLEAVGDTALGQVVGSHFHKDLIAGENTDTVLAHPASGMGNDLVFVFELHTERCVRQQFGHDARKLKDFFFSHLRIIFLSVDFMGAASAGPANFGGNYTIMFAL
ncbi:protein of unknown function [Pseudorhizobium banfieldiae]|uniref:Uncharacterized protein n=1 Tax=Pseudorhizobium banfieldiae TaxID=1125847 RepID=L0NA87_9HYPH|nr:protein of unknown function [Pseudorhizobium banfieldiae]